MDPTANLEHQLRLARRLLDDCTESDMGVPIVDSADAQELAEYVIDLDEWIRKGGFLPKPWEKQASDANQLWLDQTLWLTRILSGDYDKDPEGLAKAAKELALAAGRLSIHMKEGGEPPSSWKKGR